MKEKKDPFGAARHSRLRVMLSCLFALLLCILTVTGTTFAWLEANVTGQAVLSIGTVSFALSGEPQPAAAADSQDVSYTLPAGEYALILTNTGSLDGCCILQLTEQSGQEEPLKTAYYTDILKPEDTLSFTLVLKSKTLVSLIPDWAAPGEEAAKEMQLLKAEDSIAFGETETVSYTLTFSANGGEGTMDPVTVTGSVCRLPACGFTAPEGMRFRAWLIGETEYAPEAEISVTASLEVSAVWEETEDPTEETEASEYLITFLKNDGTDQSIAQVTTVSGLVSPFPETPTREGFTFTGWATAPEGGEAVSETYAFTADTSVYAQWAAAEQTPPADPEPEESAPETTVCTVIYVDGEQELTRITADAGQTISLDASVQAPEAMQLAAWTIDGQEYAPGSSFTVTADTTVSAVWKPVQESPAEE